MNPREREALAASIRAGGVTRDDYHAAIAKTMREDALLQHCKRAGAAVGWTVYHTHDSRRSDPGFPDLVLVHPRQKRVLYRELKAHRGQLRPAQIEWLNVLALAGQDVGVWRPTDWLSGRISTELAQAGPR